jgi:hypothetical protein
MWLDTGSKLFFHIWHHEEGKQKYHRIKLQALPGHMHFQMA